MFSIRGRGFIYRQIHNKWPPDITCGTCGPLNPWVSWCVSTPTKQETDYEASRSGLGNFSRPSRPWPWSYLLIHWKKKTPRPKYWHTDGEWMFGCSILQVYLIIVCCCCREWGHMPTSHTATTEDQDGPRLSVLLSAVEKHVLLCGACFEHG